MTASLITIVAAKRILKYVPRAVLIVDTGEIVDAKTLEVLGTMEDQIRVVGKKMYAYYATYKVLQDQNFRFQFCYHKNTKKYVNKNWDKVIDNLKKHLDYTQEKENTEGNSESNSKDYSEARKAC